jgi:hypothetical protein
MPPMSFGHQKHYPYQQVQKASPFFLPSFNLPLRD